MTEKTEQSKSLAKPPESTEKAVQATPFFSRVLYRCIKFFLWLIPGPRTLNVVGRLLGGLLYLIPSWRKVAKANIELIFGARIGASQRRRLVRDVYQHLGTTLIEMFWDFEGHGLPVTRWVELEGLENLQSAKAQGKGVIVATGHLGNWALLIHRIAAEGYVCRSMMRPPSMAGVSRFIETQTPGTKLEYVPTPLGRKSLALCMNTLRDGNLLIIVADRRSQDVKVDFMGQPAWTASGTATFHLRTGAPIVPAYILRKGNRHILRFEKPIDYQPSNDRKQDVLEITSQLNQVIGRWVASCPEQWLWVHNRWKRKKGEVDERI